MTKEVKIPQISEDADVATVGKIHVSEGDEIKKGDDLIAVESDKATVDIPNEEGDGTVKEIKVSEGDEVKVGDVILILEMEAEEEGESEDKGEGEGEGESESEGDEEEKDKKKGKKKKDSEEEENEEKEESEKDEESDDDEEREKADDKEGDEDKEKEVKAEDEEQDSEESEAEQEGKQGKPEPGDNEDEDRDAEDVPAAPLARKFARELGIDIDELKTEDPEQRITREDVMEHAKKLIQQKGGGGERKAAAGVEPIQLPDFSQWGETERQPLSGIRAAVAKNTRLSWQNIPHVTQHDRADLTELQRFREKMAEKDQKISITSVFAKICVAALEQFPMFNSSLDLENRELILKKYYNIGIAVDTDDGLMMPVIKNANQLSLDELNEELVNLAKKARERKLKPEEMKGGNFTISNLGGIGGTAFTPVIFPPQVAILGMSSSSIEPRWIEDEFVPAEMTTLSLSYDHRVIDGADAARFLRWICEVIEEPFNLLQ